MLIVNLSMGIDGTNGTTNGLFGTILNHLQWQEREQRGLQYKYKKVVKQNEELQATASGATTVKKDLHQTIIWSWKIDNEAYQKN